MNAATLREALFQDAAAGRALDQVRVAALARLLGTTVAAVMLDLLAEARGIA